MYKHWGLHISTNINRLGAVLGSFWAVWRGLLWCLKAKLRSWRFPRYWWFNKRYHGGYQLICLISRPILIASRRDWYLSKGLLKGFKLALRQWELSKNWWRYGRMKFVTQCLLVSAQLWDISGIFWILICYHICLVINSLWSSSSGAHCEGSFRFLRELSSLPRRLLILLHAFPIKHPIKRLITLTTLLERSIPG